MKLSKSNTEWVKFSKINEFYFVGRECICMTSGCHLLFVNLETNEERILRVNEETQGEGVACFVSMKTMPVVAYAESRPFPRIFIAVYPELQTINIVSGHYENYCRMAFSEGELLITLSSYPSCTLSVYKWRTGEFIINMDTNIIHTRQILKTSYHLPTQIFQAALGTNEMCLWDVNLCGKKCIITPYHIKFDAKGPCTQLADSLWTQDGNKFIVDRIGNVYQLNLQNLKLDMVIKWDDEGSSSSTFCHVKDGLMVQGSNLEVRDAWICEFRVTGVKAFDAVRAAPGKTHVIGYTSNCEMLQFHFEKNEFTPFRINEGNIDYFAMIYPMAEYFATLSHKRKFALWRVASGTLMDIKIMSEKATYLESSPVHPYVCITFENGLLEMYACINDKLSLMCSFLLTRVRLDCVKFAEEGKIIVTANKSIGQFFVIEGTPGSKFKVIGTVTAKRQIADYILIGAKSCLRLFMIFVTSKNYIAGNNIARYCIIKNQPPLLKIYELEHPERYYSKLYETRTYKNRDRLMYAVPLDNKNLHELETKRADSHARIVNRIKSRHLMKRIRYIFTQYFIATYAYDGMFMMHDAEFKSILNTIGPHHYIDGGIQHAAVDMHGRYVITLGWDGSLVCTLLTDVVVHTPRQKLIEEQMDDYREMFKKPTFGFAPYGAYENTCWLEYRDLVKTEGERLQFSEIKRELLEEFDIIKKAAMELLTKNLEGPDNEKLDIQEFNLDIVMKEEKVRKSKEKCDRQKVYYERLIAAQDKVANHLKEKYWDKMNQQSRNLCGIFSNFDVQSYAVLPPDPDEEQMVRSAEAYRELEKAVVEEDMFEPWLNYRHDQLFDLMNNEPHMRPQKTAAVFDFDEDFDSPEEALLRDELRKEEQVNAMVYFGSNVQKYITANPYHYSQFEAQTFYQNNFQLYISLDEQQKLREYFNKMFEDVFQLKVREVYNLKEKNGKLRHYVSEINYFSLWPVDVIINDPEWTQEENPDLLMKVDDSEVSVPPYITPSEQDRLDAAAAEAERIRLALLADDFKERALMKMMNGVLEIKWEDELRKDVPKPKCMAEKDPEKYNEEDLRAIRDYEEKTAFLNSERERYKSILEENYTKVGNQVREATKKFNERLKDLYTMKIQIESSCCQELLRVNRLRFKHIQKIQLDEEERAAGEAIMINESRTEDLQKLLSSLTTFINEIKNNIEMMQTKEKAVEKAYRKEFQDITQTQNEVLYKLYKRRPKCNIKTIISQAVLIELARCLITDERSLILTHDALEFLKMMDQLDKFIGVPPIIDEPMYAVLCKHRRYKIEVEIKLRALQLELAEAESTVMSYHKKLNQSKEENTRLIQALNNVRQKKIYSALNTELQLVLKEAYVETMRTGSISDFENAVLVSRKVIEDINDVIIETGKQKLKAMRNAMQFKREILMMEWEHKRKKMEIADLEHAIIDIRSIKVTKEIQGFLRSKARGETADKSLSFEVEVENLKYLYSKSIREKKRRVEELDSQIQQLVDENLRLDNEIKDINVDICEAQLYYDPQINEKERRLNNLIMASYRKRAKLVQAIQTNHNTVLVYQAELELLRLRTIPILDYKVDV